jgi:DNA-binding response OmpR family regulator
MLDVNLPDGDGVALARRLREECPAVRVLLTSGAEGHLASGDFAFISKPFGIRSLSSAVRAALDQPSP